MGKQYQQGEKIPDGVGKVYYIVLYGHFVDKVDLKYETIFPKLDDPNKTYIAFG